MVSHQSSSHCLRVPTVLPGNFESTGTTFMLSDWLVHTPLVILAQNFGLDVNTFTKIPKPFPYIFDSSVPPPQAGELGGAPTDPLGSVPTPYIFRVRDQERAQAPGGGGWTKTQTAATNFKPAVQFASNFVHVEPNGLRELHWNNFDGRFRALASGLSNGD